MINSMDSLLEFKNRLDAQLLLRTANNPTSLTLSAQEMFDLAKAISSIKEDNQLLRHDLNVIQKVLQKINNRDILKSILFKQPELVENHKKPRLAFVYREKCEESVPLSLVSIIHEANSWAHDFNVGNVYASLTDPEISAAILEVLQIRLARDVNLESLPQTDFMTLVAGVPKPLIQHALGRFIFFCFDQWLIFTESPNRELYSVLDSYFQMRFGKKFNQLSKSVKSHSAFQNPQSKSTLSLQDEKLTIEDIIFLAFDDLNDKRHENSAMTAKIITDLKEFIHRIPRSLKLPRSLPQAPSVIKGSVRTFSTMTHKFAIPTSSSLSPVRLQSPPMALRGWNLPMVKTNGLRLTKSFKFMFRTVRKF